MISGLHPHTSTFGSPRPVHEVVPTSGREIEADANAAGRTAGQGSISPTKGDDLARLLQHCQVADQKRRHLSPRDELLRPVAPSAVTDGDASGGDGVDVGFVTGAVVVDEVITVSCQSAAGEQPVTPVDERSHLSPGDGEVGAELVGRPTVGPAEDDASLGQAVDGLEVHVVRGHVDEVVCAVERP